MDFQKILDEIVTTLQPELGSGTVASYIPALARVPPAQLGIALRTREGAEFCAGDAATRFSIQSISKLFSLTLAMRHVGEGLWQRIGREPSGNPSTPGTARVRAGRAPQPFINAGAIAVADRLVSHCGEACDDVLALLSSLCGEAVSFDEEVAASEAASGFRNIALANFMKSFGKIDNDVAAVLALYFHQCSAAMSCIQLARATGYLCRDGAHPLDGSQVVSERQARRLNALMLTCGTYDAAGEFAFRIGLPCKSGVGGGIVAVVPDTLSLCVVAGAGRDRQFAAGHEGPGAVRRANPTVGVLNRNALPPGHALEAVACSALRPRRGRLHAPPPLPPACRTPAVRGLHVY